MTDAVGTQPDSSARNVRAAMVSGVASAGQQAIADALDVDKSSISKWQSGQMKLAVSFDGLAKMLDAMNMKLSPKGYRCYDPKTIDAILALAQDRLSKIRGSAELEWDPE